jgi:hypothetical protein
MQEEDRDMQVLAIHVADPLFLPGSNDEEDHGDDEEEDLGDPEPCDLHHQGMEDVDHYTLTGRKGNALFTVHTSTSNHETLAEAMYRNFEESLGWLVEVCHMYERQLERQG